MSPECSLALAEGSGSLANTRRKDAGGWPRPRPLTGTAQGCDSETKPQVVDGGRCGSVRQATGAKRPEAITEHIVVDAVAAFDAASEDFVETLQGGKHAARTRRPANSVAASALDNAFTITDDAAPLW